MKIIESDNEEDEVDTLEIINTKYNNITSRVAVLTQYQTKYHQIVQVTDRASLKVGGIEKYEYAQFGTEQSIYFEDKSKTQNKYDSSYNYLAFEIQKLGVVIKCQRFQRGKLTVLSKRVT